jgi:hypothetical protein
MAIIAALNLFRALSGDDVVNHDPQHASLS